MTLLGSVTIVPAMPVHWPAIYSGWRSTAARPGNELFEALTTTRTMRTLARLVEPTHAKPNLYKWFQTKLIDHLRNEPGVEVWVAAWAEDPAVMFGWLCCTHLTNPSTLHYVCVLPGFHGLGVATLLLQHARLDTAAPVAYTCKLDSVRYPKLWYYAPENLFTDPQKLQGQI